MTAPAEDHTGEDQFGPFIVEHNEVIRKKAINEAMDDIAQYVQKHTHCCSHIPLWVVSKEPLMKFIAELRQQEQS